MPTDKEPQNFTEKDGEVLPVYEGVNAPQDPTAELLDETAEFFKPISPSEVYEGDIPPEEMPSDSAEYLAWLAEENAKKAGIARAQAQMQVTRTQQDPALDQREGRREDGLSPVWVDLGGGIGSMRRQPSTSPPTSRKPRKPTSAQQAAREHERKARRDRWGK